jgi:hypothetical protein
VILTRRANDAAAAANAARAAITGPVTAHSLDVIDHTGALSRALGASDDSVHIVRPDGHLAAVLPRLEPESIAAAMQRVTGYADDYAE